MTVTWSAFTYLQDYLKTFEFSLISIHKRISRKTISQSISILSSFLQNGSSTWYLKSSKIVRIRGIRNVSLVDPVIVLHNIEKRLKKVKH